MFCCHYFIFLCFFNCQILQLNGFDEEHNDIFAELWQKSEKICKKSGKSEETLQTSNDNLISQKTGKIKKEIVVKDERHDNYYDGFKFNQFSNERHQKIALNKTVKEENVENRVKSEFMEFNRISDKEEFNNGEHGKEQSTDSYSIFDNLKETSSKSKGIKKKYSEVEKQEIIAEFDHLKKEFKIRAKGMSYNMKKFEEKIAQKLGVSYRTIYNWKNEFGAPKKQKNYTDAEKVELLKNFYKIKKENSQLRKDEIAQMLNIHIKSLNRWERKSKGLEPGIKKIYLEAEKQEKVAEFDELKKEFIIRAKGMSYDMKKVDEKIARTFGVSRSTINNWKKKFGVTKTLKNYTNAEKAELMKNFNKIKKENPQLRKEEIAQMLNIHTTTLNRWERESKGLEPGMSYHMKIDER